MNYIDKSDQVQTLLDMLIKNPVQFLRTHQQESTILEYKASFEYDAALDLCPVLWRNDQKPPLNPLLSQKIFQTLAAFANTQGGVLIIGVAEKNAPIVEPKLKYQCKLNSKIDHAMACYETTQPFAPMEIDNLLVVGMDVELALTGWGFDKFQRHLSDRFSMGKGKSQKKYLEFKSVGYPCFGQPGVKVKISVSESVDQHIEDVFPISLSDDKDRSYTLGVVTVRPAPRPIYLTIQESDSQSILYALPLRKTGKTELENDLRRIETYLFNRFKEDIAEEIAQKLARHIAGSNTAAAATIPNDELPMLTERLASKWRTEGWAYRLVEIYGRQLKPYLSDLKNWKNETRPNVMALLLLVSIYFGTGWEVWTVKNTENAEAIKGLLETLHMKDWWRTRFRALYALQFMNHDCIAEMLKEERHLKLSEQTRQVLMTHVHEKSVVKFIKSVSEADLGEISKKAKQVLVEIAALWNDKNVGLQCPL